MTPGKRTARKTERGSILIFTTWLLVILGIFASAVGYQVRQRLRYIQTLETREKLRAAADAGIQKAIQVVMMTGKSEADHRGSRWAGSPVDFQEIPVGDVVYTVGYAEADDKFRHGIVDDESRINLNLTKDPSVIALLFRYAASVDETRAAEIADSIADWIDEDDSVNPNGAEARYYWMQRKPYGPKNRPLDTLEELLLIRGMTPDIYVKALPYLTLHGSGRINLNTAALPVLMAKGLDEKTAKAVLDYRNGRDRKEGTPDDRYFSVRDGMAEDFSAAVTLGINDVARLTDMIGGGGFTIKSTSFTAVSTGSLPYRKEKLTLTCNITRSSVINYCKEFYSRADSAAAIDY